MSLELSPTDLCDGGVAPASDEAESVWIHATPGYSGGQPISVLRLTNEEATRPLRLAIAELHRVGSEAATRLHDATTAMSPKLSEITPAYQIRQAIASKLNVPCNYVVLIKGSTVVHDSNPHESGPFQYILKTPDDNCSRKLMDMIVSGNEPLRQRSEESFESQRRFRLNLLLNSSPFATLRFWHERYDS